VTLVVNSGPLISLARIGQLELLPALFDDIALPRGVFEEVTQDPELPGAEAIAGAEWLRVVEVLDRETVERLSASTPLLDQLGANGIHLSPRLYEEARSLAGEH
jgi:predicted nucleic acid-binding protein